MKRFLIILSIVLIFATSCTSNGDKEVLDNNETEIKSFAVGEKNIELEERTFISDKLELLIPKDFEIMSEEIAKAKYPSERRPTEILTNEDGSINVTLNYTKSSITNEQVEEYQKYLKGVFQRLYPTATWYSDCVKEIDGKNTGVLELLIPAIDTNIYNLIYFTELDGKMLMWSFNVTEDKMNDWKPIAEEIMNSIKFK